MLKPGSFATGQASFAELGRAQILHSNRGLFNVHGNLPSGRCLDAEMPFYHPVIEEGLCTALRDLDIKLRAV